MTARLHLLLVALLLAPLATLHAADVPPKKPNVILFLVDDMGWMDCGAYGSQYYKTPQIDAFARQAMRFTDAYAMPQCSPTRASILSGQYTSRHGVTSAVGHTKPVLAALQEKAPPNAPSLMPESGSYLEPSQYTLAAGGRWGQTKTAPNLHLAFSARIQRPAPAPATEFAIAPGPVSRINPSPDAKLQCPSDPRPARCRPRAGAPFGDQPL